MAYGKTDDEVKVVHYLKQFTSSKNMNFVQKEPMKAQTKLLAAEIFHRVRNEQAFSSRIPTNFALKYSFSKDGHKDFRSKSTKMPNLPLDLDSPDARPRAIKNLHDTICKLIDEVWETDPISPMVTNIGISVTSFQQLSKNRLTNYFGQKQKGARLEVVNKKPQKSVSKPQPPKKVGLHNFFKEGKRDRHADCEEPKEQQPKVEHKAKPEKKSGLYNFFKEGGQGTKRKSDRPESEQRKRRKTSEPESAQKKGGLHSYFAEGKAEKRALRKEPKKKGLHNFFEKKSNATKQITAKKPSHKKKKEKKGLLKFFGSKDDPGPPKIETCVLENNLGEAADGRWVCGRCGLEMKQSERVSHTDFHFAEDLQKKMRNNVKGSSVKHYFFTKRKSKT